MIDILHDGEDVLLIILDRLRVDSAVRFPVHQLQCRAVVKLNPMLDNIDQATALFIDLGVDVIDNRLFRPIFIHTAELLHRIVLRGLQKLKEHTGIHSKAGLVFGVRTNTETVIVT